MPGLNDELNNNPLIYPNPSEGIIRIQAPADRVLFTRLEVIDMNGRIVEKSRAGKDNIELRLNAGSYVINLYNGNQLTTSRKVVVK
ncbi:MAG: T9SS type A sorting domain-containing protein [Cyclobacteriaceae bacterium]|nr:T9SS type A sorting domain-containing protein [Cyclobacteriaceae bacterium]